MTLEQRHNSRLLWMIIGGVSIIVLLFLAAQWFFAEHQTESKKTQTPTIGKQETRLSNSTQASTETDKVSAASEPAPSTLIDDSILKTPVPDHLSLAKEEIAKLDDIQEQLKDQQSSLQAQHQDADTLIKLKEEQIKLLETQLAEQK
ncbi:hypothetical protein KTH71_07530 [Acinetobacter sp. WU_MDCI_Axc73]|nr:hypothetical protein [Acinetobacter sp. WU_MDCI_Axc73]